MIRKIGQSAGFVVYQPERFSLMQNGMCLPECNGLFNQFLHGKRRARTTPVYPSDLIVLTPGIVIAFLTVPCLISGIDHRCSLTGHKQQERIAQLLFAKLPHRTLSGRSLFSAVPGIIAGTSVLIFLSVCLVVPFFIGNRICERKPILIGKIREIGKRHSVSSLHPGHFFRRDIRIPLQKTPETGGILIIIHRNPLTDRFLYRFCSTFPVSGKQQSRSAEQRISVHGSQPSAVSYKAESVHLVFQQPVTEHIRHKTGIFILIKIKLQGAEDSCLMQCIYHVRKFRIGIIGGTVRLFRRKIPAFCVSPVIPSFHIFRIHIPDGSIFRFLMGFKKLIYRHQKKCVYPQFLKIGNTLRNTCKSSRIL